MHKAARTQPGRSNDARRCGNQRQRGPLWHRQSKGRKFSHNGAAAPSHSTAADLQPQQAAVKAVRPAHLAHAADLLVPDGTSAAEPAPSHVSSLNAHVPPARHAPCPSCSPQSGTPPLLQAYSSAHLPSGVSLFLSDSAGRQSVPLSTCRPGEFEPLQLGPHRIWPPVGLAPMAGITSAPLRLMCAAAGAPLCVRWGCKLWLPPTMHRRCSCGRCMPLAA